MEERLIESLIISYKKIEEYLEIIIKKVLDNNNYSALAILQPQHELNVIFKNCCVQYFDKENYEIYEQIAFDIVIEHFSNKKNKPTLREFEAIYKNYYEYKNMTDDDMTTLDAKLTTLFGFNYDKNIETFKEKCFIQN
jgi:hypothetical protein